MINKKKHRPVFTEEEPDLDPALEKQLMSIKSIRENRLKRSEKEYKQKLRQLESSRQTLSQRDRELEDARQKLVSGKQALLNKYLNSAVNLSELRNWSDKEEALKTDVTKASTVRDDSLEKVNTDKAIADSAKKEYQKILISIEKIDIFMEEVKDSTE